MFAIANYCLNGPEPNPPKSTFKFDMSVTLKELISWRAHADSITRLEVENQTQTITSISDDCCVRLWTWNGHFIGTFGQPVPWNLGNALSYQHPMGPMDVLMDSKTTIASTGGSISVDFKSDSGISESPRKSAWNFAQGHTSSEFLGDARVS